MPTDLSFTPLPVAGSTGDPTEVWCVPSMPPTQALHLLQDLILVLNLGHHLPKQLGLLLTAGEVKAICWTPVSAEIFQPALG